jgi:hypothetical protein
MLRRILALFNFLEGLLTMQAFQVLPAKKNAERED